MTKAKLQLIIDFIILIALYLGSRFYNLLAIPIFADEAIYIRWSQISWLDPNHRFISLSDGKPPLHIWAMIPFWSFTSDPLYGSRVLSIATGLFTMLGIYAVGKKLFNKEVGILGSFFYVIQPYALMYDRLALADSMLTAFGTWALYTALKLFQKPKLLTAIVLGILWAGAMLTKPTGLIFILLTPFIILTKPISLKHTSAQFSIFNYFSNWIQLIKQLLLPSAAASIIALGIYNLLRLSSAFYMIELRSLDYTRTQEEITTKFSDYFIQTLIVIVTWLASYLTWPVISFIVVFVFFKIGREIIANINTKSRHTHANAQSLSVSRSLKYKNDYKKPTPFQDKYLLNWSRSTWKIIYLFVIIIIPVLSEAAIGKIIFPRYSLFILPSILLILSIAIIQLIKYHWNNRIIVGSISLAVIIIAFTWLKFSALLVLNPEKAPLEYAERGQYLENWSAGYGIKDTAEFLKSIALNSKIIVAVEGYWVLESSLSIYLEGQALKNIEFVSQNPTIGHVDPYLIEKSEQGIPTYLIVNNTRLAIESPLLREIGRTYRPQGVGEPQALVIYRVINIKELPRSN